MAALVDFFISYNHRDVRWAEWIAWQLEEHGYAARIQAWDFRPGANFVLEMQQAVTDAKRTIAVLSPHYLAAEFTQPEWASAFALDPTGKNRKLILVRVSPCDPPGLLVPLVQIRLEDLDEANAKNKLLEGVQDGRAKPDVSPKFPGTATVLTEPASKPRFPGSPPPIWNVPYPPNPYFTGRAEHLSEIQKALANGAMAAVTQPTAVHGLGGIGKTQLVSQFTWLYRGEYDAVLWVNSDSPAMIMRNFAALGAPEMLRLPELTDEKLDSRISAVKLWLRTHQRWLLIFDSADSWDCIETIRGLTPPGLLGHIIITSRIAEWPVAFSPVVVDTLSEKEAVEFLTRRTTTHNFTAGTNDQVIQVAQTLGCLPLALEQAAAYILRHRIKQFRTATNTPVSP